ncbi:two-component system response regulator [Campylobacter blaseri]|uniref:DNA-binding response regulator n=1 Tax=Campylobacter blaseri TaxID=2042961 RepID=A0A2P8R3J3_9BACT|nr:response regulator transcription factor [Campylobacter blaseri]PSM53070.1 DNA-binding response regulator [Campylobacter blaseri]PSM54537.1 DNA-binding response regulator [Campylobacter blaseri]QKF86993.1 two-component system response regulator [Campylobacter blaseri]
MKILLLEDDALLSDLISTHLIEQNYEVDTFDDGEKALESIENKKYDMFIFDINVPKISGLDLLKNIRDYDITIPTIIITAYQDTGNLKKGFCYGCDDYIKKPFDLEELSQRVINLSKRFGIDKNHIIDMKTHTLDLINHTIEKDKNTYEISKKEAEILYYLYNNSKRVVSFDELFQNIWYCDEYPSQITIRVYIKNLRNIVGKDKIKTLRGLGYIYE